MYYLWLLAQHKGRAETKWPTDSEMFLPSGPLKREAVPLELLPLSGLSHWSLFNVQISVLHPGFQPDGLFENKYPW